MKSSGIWLLGLLSISGFAQDGDFRSICARQLAQQSFLQPHPWARRFSQNLGPVDPRALESLGWKWNSQNELDAVGNQFVHRPDSGQRIEAVLELYSDPDVLAPHLILLFTFFRAGDRGTPLGEGAYLFKRNKKGELESAVASFYIDASMPDLEGVSTTTRKFMEREIYKPWGMQWETIFADYIGRYAWAKVGYEFKSSSFYWPERYRERGRTVKAVVMIRQNLARFLDAHQILVRDLVVRKPGQSLQKIKSLEELERPADFAYLSHAKDQKITVRPYVAEGRLGEASPMEIGKAFMLSDYRATAGSPVIYSQQGTPFSNQAMPKWRGIRKLR